MSQLPFDQREGFIWYNGEFVKWQDAKIHVLTHALHYGCAVFEGIRVYNYKPFKLREHCQRLLNSARLLGYQIPYQEQELEQGCLEVIKQQNIQNGYLRPVAWLGSETMLIAGNNCKVHTAIAGWETFEETRKKLRAKGSEIEITEWRKPPASCVPFASKAAGLYMIATMVKNQAAQRGFDDAIMLDIYGNITEATTSNFFLITKGKLTTPIPDCFLNGLTRQTVIKIARKQGIVVEEKHIKPEELADGEAAFFTGTAIEVMPIKSITYQNSKYRFDLDNLTLKLLANEYSRLVAE